MDTRVKIFFHLFVFYLVSFSGFRFRDYGGPLLSDRAWRSRCPWGRLWSLSTVVATGPKQLSCRGEASARALVCVCQAPIPGLHVKEFLPSSRCSLMPIPYVFLSTGRHQSRSAQEKQEIGNGNCFKLDLNGVQMLSYAC